MGDGRRRDLMIDSKEAGRQLAAIDDVVRRVRQSAIYQTASLIMILWGVLVVAGNLATWLSPGHGGTVWTAVNVLGVVGTALLSTSGYQRTGIRSFDARILAAYMLFFAFGIFCTNVLGDFGPREVGAFWPIYFMFFYVLGGLWFGWAFVAIGLVITALTLVGYFFIVGGTFLWWMAVVNGGGLILGGLWMRRD
jgi:hypothetical protein